MDSGRRIGSVSCNLHGRLQSGWFSNLTLPSAPVAIQTPMGSCTSYSSPVSRRTCVKTSARFHTSLFRSLLRGLRAFRVEKIAQNFAPLDRLQNFAEFSHGLDPELPFLTGPRYGRKPSESGRRRHGQETRHNQPYRSGTLLAHLVAPGTYRASRSVGTQCRVKRGKQRPPVFRVSALEQH